MCAFIIVARCTTTESTTGCSAKKVFCVRCKRCGFVSLMFRLYWNCDGFGVF